MDFELEYYDLLNDYDAMIESANVKIISKNMIIEQMKRQMNHLQTINKYHNRIIGFAPMLIGWLLVAMKLFLHWVFN